MKMFFILGFGAASALMPHHHPQHRAPRALLDAIAKSNPASLTTNATHPARRPFAAGMRVNPIDHGADPTGRNDSWAALNAALGVCLQQSALSPNGNFPGDTSFGNGKAVRDMGGCDIDLQGGEYRISQPLVLPEYNANMQFGRGSLVAAPDFAGDFLFVIGIEGSCKVPQGSCNIDINFPELFLDGSHVASGMQINNVMGVTIGPGGYFLNFTAFGLQINNGHEVMMERCWLGETNFDFDHEKYGAPPNATAVQINGNDHYILNSIVFSSRVGIEVHGAADYVQGVHVWFPVNHAVAFANTMAFHVTGAGNRFSGCYIDGGRAVFEKAALAKNIWMNGFECCQRGSPAPGTSASGILLVGDKLGPGLEIVHNEFGGGSIYHVSELPERNIALATGSSSGGGGGGGGGPADPNCTARLNESSANKDCQGLTHAELAHDEASCAAYCCAHPTCSVYQWCAGGEGVCDGATGADAQCWVGDFSACNNADQRKGWVGMGGSVAPTPPPTPAPPVKIEGVRITHNSGGQTTQATQSLTQSNATQWLFDFCKALIFPQIAQVRVHLVAESGFPNAVARPPVGCKVTVETDVPVTGTITVDVDSSEPSAGFQ